MNVFPGLSAFGSAFWILQFACPLLNVLVEVDDLVIVFFVHEWGGDHEVGGRAVVGDRDIVYLGDAEEGFYVRVMWLGCEGIGEEYDEIDASFDDFCADLLVSSERTAVVAFDRETGGFGDHSGGCSCAAEEVSF